jgi:mono/diheme cytochrome c family protein
VIAAIWKNDLRHWLIWINFVAFSALFIYLLISVLSPKRAKTEEITPANLTPFLEDDDLESRRLERVQGWALLFATVIAIALPLYWLREPTRQDQTISYFDKNAVARGAMLYANSASPEYNAAVSLQCANCHGQKGVGGVAPTTINGVKVNWKAPPLNTEALRFQEDIDCASQSRRQANTICNLSDIITFGRPGTPMQAWGVAGGGPKNPQSIADLVAYIESIQLTSEQSQAQETAAVKAARSDDPNTVCPEYVTCPGVELANAKKAVAAAEKDLAAKRKVAQTKLNSVAATDAALTQQCNNIRSEAEASKSPLQGAPLDRAVACGDYLTAKNKLTTAQQAERWSATWEKRRANVTDGQILFELNCARCHTQGWSIFDPTVPPPAVNSVAALGLPGGGGGTGGGIGFNLRGGDTIRRFGSDAEGGFLTQLQFVSNGSAPFQPYGDIGIGSGRMPGFFQTRTAVAPFINPMLTEDQVKQIVYYERYCLDATTFTGINPKCDLGPNDGKGPRTPPTTTTSAKKG